MLTKKTFGIRRLLLLLLAVSALCLAGCKKEDGGNGVEDAGKYVYVPEFYTLDGNAASVNIYEDELYYATAEGSFYRWKPGEDEKPEQLDIRLSIDGDLAASSIQPDGDGNFYVVYSTYSFAADTESVVNTVYLAKYDGQCRELVREDISDYADGWMPAKLAVDDTGHLYVLSGGKLTLFDTDGTWKAAVDCDSEMLALTKSEDGNVYGTYSLNTKDYYNKVLNRISFEEGSIGESYKNFPVGTGLASFGESGFLTSFSGKLYCYDKSTGKTEALLEWINCDVDDDCIKQLATLQDGRILVWLQEAAGEQPGEVVILTKTDKSEIKEKKMITLGTFSASTSLLNAICKFNRENDEYRIELKEYYDPLLSTADYGVEDAKTALNLDIVSGDCPDILNLEYSDFVNYASKGLLEDLKPYLEKSGSLNTEDILQGILEAYTFQEKLAALPCTFQVHTIVGKAADIGDEMGWSLDEMMDFVNSHSDETVFAVDRQTMLEYCLTCNQSAFIDWEQSVCKFDSDSFCKLLQFCGRFPSQGESRAAAIYGATYGDAILYEVTISAAEDVNLLGQMLGDDEITFIGFPTMDGTPGNLLEAKGGSYSISAKSPYKEGAWAFLEMYLSEMDRTSEPTWAFSNRGFPSNRRGLDNFFSIAMESPYEEDINGEVELDAEGNPIRHYNMVENINDMDLYWYVPLPGEVEQITALIDSASTANGKDEQILAIIEEEAAAYFSGQKSEEEVARLIQNRVSVYMEEQR
ncbi:MAG: extracellular solute-binding protein [Roseburia sp.]